MSTVFHCILCPTEADGHYPEFTSSTAMIAHLITVHYAPPRFRLKDRQRFFGDLTITHLDIEDADGRVVGHAETITGRGR
jgi:hypothetical protein